MLEKATSAEVLKKKASEELREVREKSYNAEMCVAIQVMYGL